MEFEKRITIKAPLQVVWDKVTDVAFMASCVPGVEKIERIDDSTYRGTVTAKVGFISAAFDVSIAITARQAPTHLETEAQGKGRLGVGTFSQKQSVDLRAVSESETEAIYRSQVVVSGALASVGQRGISKKAEQMAEEFTQRFLGAFG